jgi:predicted DNA-binding protein
MRKYTLNLPEELALHVREAARELGVSKSAYMRSVIERSVAEALSDQATFQVRPPSLPISSD